MVFSINTQCIPTENTLLKKTSKRKIGKEENGGETNKKCKDLKKNINFNKEISVLRFNTLCGNNEKVEIVRIPSSQSTVSTLVDDLQEEASTTQKEEPTTSDISLSNIGVVTSAFFLTQRKAKQYPKNVPKTQIKKTQWIDSFKKEKKILNKILRSLFAQQRAYEMIPKKDQPEELEKRFILPEDSVCNDVCKVINFTVTKIVETLQDPFLKVNFLIQDREAENKFDIDQEATLTFLKTSIEKYTVESGLDFKTYRYAIATEPLVENGEETFTYKMLPDEEKEQLLNCIGDFLFHEDVKKILLNLSPLSNCS